MPARIRQWLGAVKSAAIDVICSGKLTKYIRHASQFRNRTQGVVSLFTGEEMTLASSPVNIRTVYTLCVYAPVSFNDDQSHRRIEQEGPSHGLG